MTPLVFAFALLAQPEGQDLCEKAPDGTHIVLARFLRAEPECEGCTFTNAIYWVERQIQGGVKLPREIRVRIQAALIPPTGGLHLIGGGAGLEQANWIDAAGPEPENHPVLQHLKSAKDAVIRVQTVDPDGQPMPGVQISAPGLKPIVTDAGGAAEFRGVVPGSYDLEASKHRYALERQQTSTSPGSCPSLVFTIHPKNKLTGVLVDEQGVPLPWVDLHMYRQARNSDEENDDVPRRLTNSDEDGRFTFENLAAGRYRLEANGGRSGSATLLPSRFFDRIFDFTEPGAEGVDIRFVVPGLGRRGEVDVVGRDTEGRELFWDFLAYSASSNSGGEPASACCSSWPRVRFNLETKTWSPLPPRRHNALLFENLSYAFPSQSAYRDDECYVSAPLNIPAGSKPSAVTLRFQKVACPAGP